MSAVIRTERADQFDFSKRFSPKRKKEFAKILMEISEKVGFKMSSRGWAYALENYRYINKNQFDRVSDAINDLRRTGYLPVDFVREDGDRMFKHVHEPYEPAMNRLVADHIRRVTDGYSWYNPDHWRNSEVYIQVIVEKVDLISLFEPLCRELGIPIANSKGWSSIMQRAVYARRFKEAAYDGKRCILLYCGDFDPDGLRISDTLRTNLEQIKDVLFEDGETGYDPADLEIHRFGLEYDFIIENNLTWIDNLITGSQKKGMPPLDSTKHPNHYLPYVQDYLKKVGARKCEANALVVAPVAGRQLFFDAVSQFLDIPALRAHMAELEEDAKRRYDEALDKLTIDVTDMMIPSGEPGKTTFEVSVRDFIDASNNL